jgi:Ca-activated chloride channel family protein
MTDGESNYGKRFQDLEKAYKEMGMDVPVFSITFGKASSGQLSEIEELTRARVFDGRHDLVKAFRKAKGYN